MVIATGAVTTLAGSPGNYGKVDGVGDAARFSRPTGLACDGAGNLFVADSDNHAIRKVVITTATVTLLATLPGGSSGSSGIGVPPESPSALVTDGAGNLFVTDQSDHTIRKVVIATGAVSIFAGAAALPGSADGIGGAARFSWPSGMTIDGAGNLFVADMNNHTVRKVVIATAAVTTVAGSPHASGSVDGAGTAARFDSPYGLVSDGTGNLLVSDRQDRTIRKIVIATGAVTTLAGSSGEFRASDGARAAAKFASPSGLAIDGGGNLFVADSYSNAVRKVDPATGEVTTPWGLLPHNGPDDGVGDTARFDGPCAAVTDGAGNLFVADTYNQVIRKVVIATGAVTTFVGSPGKSGDADGIGSDARFDLPNVIATDGAGNLFVSDVFHCTVRKIILSTRAVTTLAGSPEDCQTRDGTGTDARFAGPVGLAGDGAGNIFVSDAQGNTIRKVVIATGTVTTIAGSGNAGHVDGIGRAAQFSWPSGLTTDGLGNLLVTDTENHAIRKIVVATGEVTTVAGSEEAGDVDGVGAAARFSFPSDLISDGDGNIFVSDGLNHKVRKVVVATGAVSTVVGSPGRAGVALGPLPATLNYPTALAVGPSGELIIADYYENALLVVRFK